jgi:transposase
MSGSNHCDTRERDPVWEIATKYSLSRMRRKELQDMEDRGKKARQGQRSDRRRQTREFLKEVNLDAAGVDIGSRTIVVCVPKGRDPEGKHIRPFSTLMPQLRKACEWLKRCGVKTVAMESTGVYWIPLYELLEEQGFEVYLVDARKVKNVTGRKGDETDAEWLQKLHRFGLLRPAFRPAGTICALRAYQRHRSMLVKTAATHIQHMHKALSQMGLQLHHVLRDVMGVTGQQIVRSILAGERDGKVLAKFRDPKCKNSEETIAQALEGNYREEHLFSLRQAVELYDCYQEKIRDCDREIERKLRQFQRRAPKERLPKGRLKKSGGNEPAFDLRSRMFEMTGVDLTRVPGLNSYSVLQEVSETGVDMSPWSNHKRFTSWLGLSPNHRESGGKILGRSTPSSANRAATIFRLAARSLYNADNALGAFYRRVRARRGAPKAITATARKIAVIYYSMLRDGTEYVEKGQEWYDQQYRSRVERNLRRRAADLGFRLLPLGEVPNAAPS